MESPSTKLKYPKSVLVDFRKLEKDTLIKILRSYQVEPKEDVTQTDLAVLVAMVFEASSVAEEFILDKFSHRHADPLKDLDPEFSLLRKRTYSARESLDREPAQPGEQVAAKVSKTNEDGSWILGNVLDYDPRSQLYAIQDEDDVGRVVNLPFTDVKRLQDTAAHLRRSDQVLVVFPETTSFYRATIAKRPKAPSNPNASWDVVVKFNDDEDENGKSLSRRVPARFVLPISVIEESW